MENKFKVGTQLLFQNAQYNVVGIDYYSLQNHLRQTKIWKSYTLVGNNERIGLSIMDKTFTIWRTATEVIKNGVSNFDFSGMANITFVGDKGPSTPLAELTWFDIDANSSNIFLIERFLSFSSAENLQIETFYQLGSIIIESDIQLVKS